MSTKTSDNQIDMEKIREIVREEVERQFAVSRFRELQRRLAPYRENAEYESEEELLADIS